jgi:hypothetical protein
MGAEQTLPVPLPSFLGAGRGPDAVCAAIEQWIRSPPLQQLVRSSAAEIHFDAEAPDLLRALDQFSQCWDFRQGRERQDGCIPSAAAQPPAALVATAASSLGFRDGAGPTERAYTHMLVLGGLAHSCITRAAHAARLRCDGIRADFITALAGLRPLSHEEHETLRAIAQPPQACEFDLLAAALEQSLRLGSPTTKLNRRRDGEIAWIHREYPVAEPTAAAIGAGFRSDHRRATTPDTFELWLDTAPIGATDRVLVITTDPYVPYQGAVAIRLIGLSTGAEVETIGLPPGSYDPRLRRPLYPHSVLQEIRSTIRAFRSLWQVCESHPTRGRNNHRHGTTS